MIFHVYIINLYNVKHIYLIVFSMLNAADTVEKVSRNFDVYLVSGFDHFPNAVYCSEICGYMKRIILDSL